MNDAMLTVEDVAERLNVSVWSVRNYIRDGGIPAVRIGRSIRIPLSWLDRYIVRQTILKMEMNDD